MIRLLHDHIIVQMDESETKSDGGIHLPEGRSLVDGGLIWGTVLQVGPGKLTRKGELIPIDDLNVGDRVMFCRHISKVESNKGIQHIMDDEYGPRALMLQVKDVVCVESGSATESEN